MKLNTLKADGFNKIKWCGPTALAIITGRTLRYCHNKLANIKGVEPRYLKGVYNFHMRKALSQMGYEAIPIVGPYSSILAGHKKTLRAYIEEHQTTEHFRGVVLINVTGHYVVAHRGMVADNHSNGEAAPVSDHKYKRTQVRHAWFIQKKKSK